MHPEPQALEALSPSRAFDVLYEEAARGLDPIGHLCWDDGGLLQASPAAVEILGLRPNETLSVRGLLAMVRRSRHVALMSTWTEAIGTRQRRVEMELPCVRTNGVLRHVRIAAIIEYDPQGMVRQVVAALQDVTLAQQLSVALTAAEARLEEAQQMADFGSWEWDFQRNRAIYSAEAMRITGLSNEVTVSSGLDQAAALIPNEQREAVLELFKRAVRQRLPSLRYDYHVADANGQRREIHGRAKLVYDGNGTLRRMLGTIQDVTELRDYRRQVHSLAFFDPVTALPNRSWLVERLHKALSQMNGQGHVAEFGVLMLGLDQFKKVNDSLGHSAGDELLKLVGARLSQSMRETDVVARLSGDTFAILTPEVRQADVLARVASKLLQALAAPFDLSGTDLFVTASIGAALYPSDGNSAEALLQHADAALSHAKGRGRNNVQFYSPQLTAQASHRLMLESELRRGVERQELLLHYQPKFDMVTQKLVGAEALMRWCQPRRGMVSPMSFIPLAEETGLIVRMGTWALHEACNAVASWNRGRAEPLKIAVNLSVRQFAEGHNLAETVQGALAACGCRPEWLELEITESLLLDGSEGVRQSLEALALMGITIAIDDFGTGYSALGYLTRLPVQTLKIDRSFVAELPHNSKSAELVKAIVSVGRSLNMALVAEGVETQEQADYLTSAGCHLAQGYLFGRPLEMAAFDKLLTN